MLRVNDPTASKDRREFIHWWDAWWLTFLQTNSDRLHPYRRFYPKTRQQEEEPALNLLMGETQTPRGRTL